MTKSKILILFASILSFTTGCKKYIVDKFPTIRYENISVPTKQNLHSVYFMNVSLGFIGGEKGTLLKTTDGGTNWTNISIDSSYSINKIIFTSKDTGFIGSSEGVSKTVNGGKNWTLSFSGISINDIFFVNKKIGYAVGNSGSQGKFFKSLNGGNSWAELKVVDWPASASPLNAVCFVNADTGYVVGAENCNITTSDGGLTWSGNFGDVFTDDLYDIKVFKGEKYIVGANGTLPSYNAEKYNIYAIAFNDEQGLIVGQKCVYKKEVGFEEYDKWSYMLTSEGTSFNNTYLDVCFSEHSTAFAVGLAGIVTKFHVE